MAVDADITAALGRAAAQQAQGSPAPPVDWVMRAGRRRRVRRRAAGATAGLVAVGVFAFAVAAAGPGAQDQVVADGNPPRTVPIGEMTARFLSSGFPKTGDRPSPDYPATVLASADTTRGELLLIGVDLPSGKKCVLLQYAAERTPGGGGGGRCVEPGKDPYASGRFDISGQQELDPAGGNVSVAFGSAPSGTAQVTLSAPDGTRSSAAAAESGGPWSGRAFFIAFWPAPKPGEITGYAADGAELTSAPLPLDPAKG